MTRDSVLFKLLRVGLHTTNAKDEFAGLDSSINDLLPIADYSFSVKQGVGAFVFDGLQLTIAERLIATDAVEREVKMKLFSHSLQLECLCKAQYAKAAELAKVYADNSIRTVVLKGIAAGQCYPNPWHRPCGDLDCYLLGDYERGNEFAKSLGASVDDHSYKHSHIKYNGLTVENHQFCTPISGCKRTKRFERLLHEVLATDGTTRIGKTQLENPAPLFNALFLTYHGRSHFLIDGITLRHLCDWAMLLHKHGKEIDWLSFCKYADEYGLRGFADAMTCLSRDWLGIAVPTGYEIKEDNVRNHYLFQEMLLGLPEHEHNTSHWKARMRIVGQMKKNRARFKMFSDKSFEKHLLQQLYAFLFDRKPTLEN